MKIDIESIGYRWKGYYNSSTQYKKGDVVRKDGGTQMFNGASWVPWAKDQQNATYKGELATAGSGATLRGAIDQNLYVNALGDDIEFRHGEGRTSSAPIALAETNTYECNGNANGGYTAAALMTDGTVCMWGHGTNGSMGDGAFYDRSKPVRAGFPQGTPPIVKIYRGYYNTFAVDADGKCWAWGYNNVGQLGIDNGTTNTAVPTLVNGKGDMPLDAKVVEVKAGSGYYTYNSTMFRTEDGRCYHAGQQRSYSAGTQDNNTQHNAPKLIPRSLDINVVEMFNWGHYNTATWLLDDQGRLWGAGEQNTCGRINNNADSDTPHQLWTPSVSEPVLTIRGEESDQHVSSGSQYYRQYMIITQAGNIYSWGHGSTYSSSTNVISDNNGVVEKWVPKKDSRIDNVIDGYVGAGWYHQAMVLKADGTVWAIGSNQDSLFETNANNYAWVEVYPDTLTNVVKLFPSGGRHGKACGYLTADGLWYQSGMNNYGSSGDGSTNQPLGNPALLPGAITQVTMIGTTNDSANYTTIYAMCEGSNNVYSWGYNSDGQLGWDDDEEYSCVPSPVLF